MKYKFKVVQVVYILKLRCDSRFQRAFTACSCVFKVITLIGSNQGNHFENAFTCSKRMRKTLLATLLYLFRKRVSSHIWQPSNIYGNPATFNKRERNHERLHPKPFN